MNVFNYVNRYDTIHGYARSNDIVATRGANASLLKSGTITDSVINKLHLVKLSSGIPYEDKGYQNFDAIHKVTKYSDLCQLNYGAMQYEVDDFLYCRMLGLPINKLITLRRFPLSCVDNIYDTSVQEYPDICRMLTFFGGDVNPLHEIMDMKFNLQWKELTSTFEEGHISGGKEGGGLPDSFRKIAKFLDPTMAEDAMANPNWLEIDPTYDQNKVYGLIDSIHKTHIRDVGLNNEKTYTIKFQFDSRSYSGRTPEYVMRDIIANAIACTYNNAKFWGGTRFWMGERPSNFLKYFEFGNTRDLNTFYQRATTTVGSLLKNLIQPKKLLEGIKTMLSNSIQIGIGSLLDKMGRPAVPYMNSLLTGEPVGNWHLTVGNPINPILCAGNLICDEVNIKFPENALSYGEFPTKVDIEISLKQAMPRDRAGLEMMFNAGTQRIYFAPNTVPSVSGIVAGGNPRNFGQYSEASINQALSKYYDFMPKGGSGKGTSTASELGLFSGQQNDPTGKATTVSNANSKSNPDAPIYAAVVVGKTTGKVVGSAATFVYEKTSEMIEDPKTKVPENLKKAGKVASNVAKRVGDWASDFGSAVGNDMANIASKAP
jgi:hypothetical protein